MAVATCDAKLHLRAADAITLVGHCFQCIEVDPEFLDLIHAHIEEFTPDSKPSM
jgi:hypothetical protein